MFIISTSRSPVIFNLNFKMLQYHKREHKSNKNANFVLIVYLLARLCNIFDDAFLLTSVHVYKT